MDTNNNNNNKQCDCGKDKLINDLLKRISNLEFEVEDKDRENERLNNIINELENTIENFMENHTEGYLDWKYDREIYLAESNILQKLYDTYFEKLQELKGSNNNE